MAQAPDPIFDRLFMVRHGESTCNTVHRIAGCRDAPLTLLGRVQAEKVARAARRRPVDRVYVSPLSRASETADIIFGGRTNARPEVVFDDRLMERDFGSYTLESKAILQRRHGIAEYERAMNGDSPTMRSAETFEQFRSRVRAFFDEELVPALRAGHVVCVVSHKYVVELICRFVLDRPAEDAYDLRLPNSQMLQGSRVADYVKRENRLRNMAYDWLVVHHPLVFCAGLAAGLLGDLAGLRVHVSPYVLLAILVVASLITMCRIELESAREHVTDQGTLRVVLVRYLILPVVAALVLYWWDGGMRRGTVAFAVILFATPSSVVAMTVSRCLGGMIMPAFAHVLLSSLAAAIAFSAVLGLTLGSGTATAVAVSAAASTGVVVASYLTVRRLRRRSPIRVAKFGERNAHLAVLLLTVFVVLVMLGVDLPSAVTYGPVAVAVTVGLRLVARALMRRHDVRAIDDYVAMSYPNVFVVVVIALLTGNAALGALAVWCLPPMFALSFFDGRYAGVLVVPPDDERWLRVLRIRDSRPRLVGNPGSR